MNCYNKDILKVINNKYLIKFKKLNLYLNDYLLLIYIIACLEWYMKMVAGDQSYLTLGVTIVSEKEYSLE